VNSYCVRMSDDLAAYRYGPISMTTDPATGLTSMEFQLTDHGPLVAVLSADEVERIKPLLEHIAEHVAAGQPARIDLRAAFLDLIGRDPFTGQL
jgi:hypothetical protein